MIVLDRVWMLVSPNNKGVVYSIATNAMDIWNTVIEDELMGSFETKASLHDKGYRARKVTIVLEESGDAPITE